MAARDKYSKAERDAWQRKRIAEEVERGNIERTGPVAAFLEGKPFDMKPKAPEQSKPLVEFQAPKIQKPFSPKAERKATTALEKDLNKMARKFAAEELDKKLPNRAGIEADTSGSSVFASLTYEGGVATAEFFRGGDVVYDYPMSRKEFLEWADDDSLGGFFNDNVR